MRQSKQIILTLLLTVVLVSLSWFAGQSHGQIKTTPVVVMKQDVKAGTQLEEAMMSVMEAPASFVSDGWMTQIQDANGKIARTDLQSGEILHEKRLTDEAVGFIFPGSGPGKRMMTIHLDAPAANGFWLAEGNRVDIHLIPRSGTGSETQILENIKILKILDDDNSTFSADREPLLCLDLTCDQAALLAEAEAYCVIKLAVVNENGEGAD